MLVDGARTNGATARQRHLGVAKPREQGAQRQHRGAHGLDQLVGGFGQVQTACIGAHAAIGMLLHLNAHVTDQFEHGRDVLQARHVAQRHWLSGQQGGAQLGQGSVLGA